MSTKKIGPSPGVSQIVREQLNLMKTEKELKAALDKINEQINELLVEELHLKSALIEQNQKKMPNEPMPSSLPSNRGYPNLDSASIINEQNLNLSSARVSNSLEEEDD